MCLNLSFFALQALMPRIAQLLQLLGPEPVLQQEEDRLPFVLVDASFLDEELDPDALAHAESSVSREARQDTVSEVAPDAMPHIEEGVDEILNQLPGNPGPGESFVQAPESVAETQPNEAEETPAEEPREAQEDLPPEPDEPEEASEPAEPAEPPPVEAPPPEPEPEPEPEPPPEPVPEPLPEPPPEPIQEQEPPPEPIQEWVPPPPVEPPPEPEVLPEPPPEIWEEPPVVEEYEPVQTMPEPVAEPEPAPVTDMVDLAMLPVTPDGFFDPRTQALEEAARRAYAAPQPVPERRDPPPEEYFQPQQQPPAEPQRQQHTGVNRPQRRNRNREGRPQATIQRMEASAPSTAGGSPRTRNQGPGVRLLDSDPNMRILASRYGEYMAKVARQLQESLNRVLNLNPSYYARGQGKIRFTIAADGTLGYSDTLYPVDGSNDIVRRVSETTLREAAPFDPPTEEMLRDPYFQKMSLTVNLY